MKQYIGARYVPKVFNNNGNSEWVSGITYENLTIVSYLNNLFMSTKNVPSSIGSPNENPTFWANLGFGDDLQKLEEEVATLSAQTIENTENIATNSGDITNIKNDINNIESELSGLDINRKYLYFGDSFLNIPYNWGIPLDTLLGITATKIAEGGAGFVNAGNSGHTFTQLFNTSNVPNDITDMIIVGGCNDYLESSVSALADAIERFISAVRVKLPNARLYFAWNSTWCNGASTWYPSVIGENYRTFTALICKHTKCFIMKSPTFNIQDKFLLADDLHPNTEGIHRLAMSIYNELNGLSSPSPIVHDSPLSPFRFKSCVDDKFIIECKYGQTLFSGNSDITAYTGFDLGTFDSPIRTKNDGGHIVMNVLLKVDHSDGSTVLNAMLYSSTSTGHLYLLSTSTFTGVTEITIRCGGTYIFDAYY